jgi:NADH:ubiquinone oxidoreductase subunit F (NADH-binding)/NADH:ubiquinone oxidoreductase subunit E/Pyruvate/2-oxoacid:ferredoxin oxidoreductase delta subunit
MEEQVIEIVDKIVVEKGKAKEAVIPILQAIQDKFNYLPQNALKRVCETTEITPSQITGISTFYTQFRHKPVGKHILKVCVGTACHVKGALLIYDSFKRALKLGENEDTDASGTYTMEKVACLGCCTIAPVVQIDNITYGKVESEKVSEILEDFIAAKDASESSFIKIKDAKNKFQGEIRVGLGSCCVASGSADVKAELERAVAQKNISVDIKHVGCVGVCNQVPILEIHKEGKVPVYYTKVKPEDIKQVVNKHFKPEGIFNKIKDGFFGFFENTLVQNRPNELHKYPADKRESPITEFLDGQISIATEFRGELKPLDIEEYKSSGGFTALRKCLVENRPHAIIETILASGLRGRGGGGFPSGIKWELVKDAESDKKYVICNGDEGDPGAFMDRMLLESYPFRVIEGVIIAAYAVGATDGIFYIRAEYPLAVKRIKEAIAICNNDGWLGQNIKKSGFSLNLKVFEGAGAFICGEETALIASIEGKRGLPSIRPPYPAKEGLWGKPTLINNTETLALVPWIVRNGHEEFNKIGTEHSKGTKVFALAGKINRGGLIEVPMGITIRQIVERIGGGIANHKEFKAVQIGGPSGGCIPATLADTPIDFQSLEKLGAMMGSGGLIVLDETDCMVDIAKYFLSFTQDQSCGKCTFCRIGTRRMLDILEKITEGKGTENDLEVLEQLAISTNSGSICNLGRTAPNPVLSTLKYFRHEYEAHINGKCPSGKCKALIKYQINDSCIGCTICAQKCPSDAIIFNPYKKHEIIQDKCIKCDVCRQVCPEGSVFVQ